MNTKRITLIVLVLLIVWNVALTVALTNSTSQQDNSIVINEVELTGFSTDFSTVIDQVLPSVCSIRSEKGLSSGFVYAQENDKTYVLTTYHSVSNSQNIQVLFDNDLSVNASIYAYDLYSDVCLLEMDFNYWIEPLKIGDASLLQSGEFALVLGTPISLEFSNTASLAMISSDHRIIDNTIVLSQQTYNYYRDVVQFTSTLNPGNSGGPLFNMAGELIGMCVMEYDGKDGEGIYFATSSNEIQVIVEKMLKGENYQKHQFGMKGKSLASMQNYEKAALGLPIDVVDGYFVSNLKTNQIASMAGVLSGDVLLEVNNQVIKDSYDLMEVQYLNTNIFTFKVLRNDEILELVGYIND